jgi:hypothetical protein
MNIKVTLLAVAFLGLTSPVYPGEPTDLNSPAAQTVRSFYQFHFHHSMGFSEAGLKAREKWLDTGLYDMLLKELKKPQSPNEAPDMEGDPFTNSQEYPNSFQVTKSTETGDAATVNVVFQWPKGGNPPRPATIQLRKDAKSGAWKISNVVSDGDDLVADLKKSLSQK